jgi:hypothetical protein
MPLASIFERANKVIAVWPGEDEAAPIYDGTQVVIPPRTEVAQLGGRYRFPAAKDAQGRPIPGTVILQDEFTSDPVLGSTVTSFDARGWAKGILSINPGLIERGLDFVESPEDVPAAMERGIPKWTKARIAQWRDMVNREAARRANAAAHGHAAEPLSEKDESELARAIRGLREDTASRRSGITDADLLIATGGTLAPSKPTTATAAATADAPPPPADDFGEAATAMYRLAKEHKVKLATEEVEGLMARDSAVMTAVASKLEAAGVEV